MAKAKMIHDFEVILTREEYDTIRVFINWFGALSPDDVKNPEITRNGREMWDKADDVLIDIQAEIDELPCELEDEDEGTTG